MLITTCKENRSELVIFNPLEAQGLQERVSLYDHAPKLRDVGAQMSQQG